MRKKDRRECTDPRKNDSIAYRVTPVMKADTYDERLSEEMKEELAAIVLAETFPETLNYKVPQEEEEDE